MKPIPVLLLSLVTLPAAAGQVIVDQGLSTAETFALRDRLARDHEWQEWLRLQQAISWLEVLPINCELMGGHGGDYRCGDGDYRPFRQNGRDLYIRGNSPGSMQDPRSNPDKKAP